MNAIPGATHLTNPSISSRGTMHTASMNQLSLNQLDPPLMQHYPYSGYPVSESDYSSSSGYSSARGNYLAAAYTPSYPPYPSSLGDSIINVKVNSEIQTFALIDTGSSLSFISKALVELYNLPVNSCDTLITMASETHTSKTLGVCSVNLDVADQNLGVCKLLVLEKLCCGILLGLDVLSRHSRVSIQFNGGMHALDIMAPRK